MRSISRLEIAAVSGADLYLGDNCWFHVPSTGIPVDQFLIIENACQGYFDGNYDKDYLVGYLAANVDAFYLGVYADNLNDSYKYCH